MTQKKYLWYKILLIYHHKHAKKTDENSKSYQFFFQYRQYGPVQKNFAPAPYLPQGQLIKKKEEKYNTGLVLSYFSCY